MNIEAKGFKIELDLEELRELAYALKISIIHSLKTHWVSFQYDWEKHEQKRLKILKTIFISLDELESYESTITIADKIFKEYNEKNKR